jgi:hypothetical protein
MAIRLKTQLSRRQESHGKPSRDPPDLGPFRRRSEEHALLIIAAFDQSPDPDEVPTSLLNVPRNFLQCVRDLDVRDQANGWPGFQHAPPQRAQV